MMEIKVLRGCRDHAGDDTVGAVVEPGSTCLDELAGRDHRGMANEGDEIALAASFDTQNAEAVLGVMKRDAVDQARQDLHRARRRCPHHPAMMDGEILGYQNSRPNSR